MKIYSIQVGYKGTNGRLNIHTQVFEGENPEAALEMAKAYYSAQIPYRKPDEMIYSTPIESTNTSNGSVSIGGAATGVHIVTGDGNIIGKRNTVIQQGKHNINIGTAIGLDIGD